MFISATTLKLLMDKGLNGDDLVEVYRALEADFRSMEPPAKDAAAERRRAYDRERKRKSTGIPPEGNSAISTGIPPETSPSRTGAQVVIPSLPSLRSEEAKTPTEPSGSVAPKGVKRPKGSKRVPTSWIPEKHTLAVLEGEGFTPGDLERALTRMRDHEFRNPRTDWDATFRNWVRQDADRKPRHERSHPDKRHTAFVERLSDIDAAMAAAVEQRGGSG